MAAPITINKSNYYVTGGMYALGNDVGIKNLPDKGVKLVNRQLRKK